MRWLLFFGLTFFVSAVLTRRFCQPDSALFILDHPNERSLHHRPVPRSGGLAMVAAILISAGLAYFLGHIPDELLLIGAAGGIVVVMSFADDRYSISPLYRLTAHAAAAAVVISAGYRLPDMVWPGISWAWPPALAAIVSGLFVVWMINLYNFMDGIDGFAGGMAVFGFGGFAAIGWLAGDTFFMLANIVVVAAAAGFLIFNFPPARIFMGDVGSSVLGFLAAGYALWGAREQVVPIWIALLLFSPFIVDATFTLGRRLWHGERLWEAHRSHVYQRLVQCGWGHRKTVMSEYLLMAACVATALWALHQPVAVQQATILVWIGIYAGLIILASTYESRVKHAQNTPHVR